MQVSIYVIVNTHTHMRARLPPFPFPGRWACAFRGHAKIDVQKIEPQNSNLHELDPDMRFAPVLFFSTPPPSRRVPAPCCFPSVVVTNGIFFVNLAAVGGGLRTEQAGYGQVVGRFGQVVGVEGQVVGVETQVVGVEGQVVGVEEQVVGVEEQV